LAQLNNCQQVFSFVLADRDAMNQRLRISPRNALREVARLSSSEGRRRILQSYLTEKDWVEQTRSFLTTCPISPFDEEDHLAIAIGAGVYVLDDDGVTFQGSREADAYTCIYEYRIMENATDARPISEVSSSIDAFAAISAIRYEPVFGMRYQIRSDKNRAERARYIVTNLTHFLAARSFWTTLAREHSGQSCVMETNWGGGDYLAGYYTGGLCEACVDLLHSNPKSSGLSYRMRHFSEGEVIKALNALCLLPNEWDRQVRFCSFLSERLLPLFAGAIGLGLVTNLVAGFANSSTSKETYEILTYVKEHSIAVTVTIVSAGLAIIGLGVLELLRINLP
jgi:hypothetical protein